MMGCPESLSLEIHQETSLLESISPVATPKNCVSGLQNGSSKAMTSSSPAENPGGSENKVKELRLWAPERLIKGDDEFISR